MTKRRAQPLRRLSIAALLGAILLGCAGLAAPAQADVKVSAQGTPERVEIELDWAEPVEADWRKDDGDIVITFSRAFEPRRLDEVVATQSDWIAFAVRGFDSVLFVLRDGIEGRVVTKGSIVRLELRKSPQAETRSRAEPDAAEAAIRLELARARLLQAQGRLLEARRGLRLLMDKHPERVDLMVQLAGIEGALERPEHALFLYNRILEVDPDNEGVREAKASVTASLAGAGGGSGAPAEAVGTGRVKAETTVQQIREADRQVISVAEGSVQATQEVKVEARVERRDVKARSIQGPGGRTEGFTSRKIRGEAKAVIDTGDLWQATVSLYGAEKTVGAGASVRVELDDLIGFAGAVTGEARLNEPYWGLIEGIVHNATRHRAGTNFAWRRGPYSGSIGLNLNRYGIDDTRNAADTVGLPLSFTYSPEGGAENPWSGLALSYLFDAEYLLRQKVKFDTAGVSFRPLGLVTREIHSFQTAYDREVLEKLKLSGFLGYSWDRFNSDGFFGGGSLTYEPFRGVELGLRFVQNITSSQGGDDVVQQFGGHVAFDF